MANKLKKMQEKVKAELEHIPNWPEPQNELRMIYQTRRMHSLGKKVIFAFPSRYFEVILVGQKAEGVQNRGDGL